VPLPARLSSGSGNPRRQDPACLRRFRASAGPGPRTRSVDSISVPRPDGVWAPANHVTDGSARSLVGRATLPSHPFTRWVLPRRRLVRRGRNHRATPRRLGKPCGCPPRSRERCSSSTSANQPASRALVDFARFPPRRSEEALDGALPLRSALGSQPSPERGSRAARYRAPRFGGASSGEPPGTAFWAVPEASWSASDALCRARADRPCGRPAREPGPPLPLLSSKRAAHLDPARLPPPKRPVHARLRGRFRCRSPASCNRYDSRARPRGPHQTLPRRVRLPSPAVGTWRQRSCEHRRPALLGPGGRERLSPHRPRPGNARRSYPETDPCRAPRFMSSSRGPAGEAGRMRRRRREDDLTREPRSREIRAATLRAARAVRSDARFWPRPDHVTEGRPPCRPREGEARLAAPEMPSSR
jgi:hypothetical protein